MGDKLGRNSPPTGMLTIDFGASEMELRYREEFDRDIVSIALVTRLIVLQRAEKRIFHTCSFL